MKKLTYLASALLMVSLGGCVTIKTNAHVKYVKVDSPNTFSSKLDEDARVYLELPPGKISIYESPKGQAFTASLSRSCPENDMIECQEELEEIQFVAKSKDGKYSLTTNKSTMFNSDGKFSFEIYVPNIHHLDVEVSAGEVNIDPLRSCVTADLSAGELNIKAYAEEVNSVSLHASAGETSLRANGRRIPEERFLMRSKTNWNGGEGNCDLKAEVGAGEVSVRVI